MRYHKSIGLEGPSKFEKFGPRNPNLELRRRGFDKTLFINEDVGKVLIQCIDRVIIWTMIFSVTFPGTRDLDLNMRFHL